MKSNELREKYLEFFRQKGHTILQSASIFPENDPTVLFTTAGMHPLQPYFKGQPHPSGKRLTNSQKCIRTGDIEEVGDPTHLTFFEMLGNWSLGDYFKEDAIKWSLEFLTDPKWLGIDVDRLSVTVFAGDDEVPQDTESYEIWKSLGIPEARIYLLPREDNWWGLATGPCGPDTEMFFDTGKVPCSKTCRPGCHCGKYFEIWNDVFMSYNKLADGSFGKLAQHNVDTGMGIERTIAVLNGATTIHEIDTIQPINERIKRFAKINTEPTEEQRKSINIIADHIRSATFILGDDKGVSPSNLGQGYVLRRFIRGIIRQGNLLNIKQRFLPTLAEIVMSLYSDIYPELERNKNFIMINLTQEENKFSTTLKRGLKRLGKILDETGTLTGQDAFLLFTSFGFPLEMTLEIANEKNITIDTQAFQKEFTHHKDLSRKATSGTFKSGLSDHTEKTTRLHTATHLLQQALREVLGDHVEQKGSNITPERTRFDFTHSEKLLPAEIEKVEQLVNKKIKEGLAVKSEILTPKEAKASGALGFFEDKYQTNVSVYSIGSFSKEICTGPHVKNTKEIGTFTIQKQKNIGTGLMRIRAKIEP
ncbi:alanine--tRNA ligase [Candidatus Heimdallarchaeota archaeon B3_Heim]|nr:MAG: alanine--tRNA ligase [Candidatus Heimdallarchaeota archaeon B3_Heim]